MRQQKLLQSGAVTASTRRTTTWVLVLLAWAVRIWTDLSSGRDVPDAPAPLGEFLTSSQWPWVDPPLPGLILALGDLITADGIALLVFELLAATIVVVSLLRLGERWLDFDAAVLGALLWATCAPALAIFKVPGSEGWQAALAVMVAGAMLATARRRAPEQAWRIGALAGVLTLFSGGGMWWALGSMGWLPMTSSRFRGWGFARSAALIAGGWLVVVMPFAARNAFVGGGDPQFPGAGDFARFHAAMHAASVAAPGWAPLPSDAHRGPRSAAYADSVLAAARLPVDTLEWTRSTNLLSLALQEAAPAGGAGWKAVFRRPVAALGGWVHPEREPVIAVPWAFVVLFAWIGVVALLPGLRQLFPLLLGGLVPLAQGSLLGLSTGTMLAASPFVCLYAGYGIWRIWTGRRAAITWWVAPVVLLLAVLLHLSVRSWA